ncbi:hypothetical protein ACQKQC_19235 [Vibrio fortis]|uniref:hypothetical protein n=1 Tax=Vibrio fortis TaxID=212667 RepID=UPI00406907A2
MSISSTTLANTIQKYSDFKVEFHSNLSFVGTDGNTIQRTVVSGGVDDIFPENNSAITIVCTSHDGSFDFYQRVDELEAALKSFLGSIHDGTIPSPESLFSLKEIRNKTLQEVISHGDFSSVRDVQDICNAILDKKLDDHVRFVDKIVTISVDIGYGDSDRAGLRVFSDQLEEIVIDSESRTIKLMMGSTCDNFDAGKRICELESLIDKLLNSTETSKTRKPRKSTISSALRKIADNKISAY